VDIGCSCDCERSIALRRGAPPLGDESLQSSVFACDGGVEWECVAVILDGTETSIRRARVSSSRAMSTPK
jgi:hypothetical protein